ncbi:MULTISPECIES: HNH endonuclease [unclassified Methylophaga]|uniref:HNH endonuclease n=1 Tax=unclassified Methylophaga TaxID=2629249 RepID=UPI000C992427|nr:MULTISPECIES: HNH endonuclease signature motif containing protein [unclassified Methylophaga]MBN45659.1 HNH endonuclease [Methylophaga sp.]|tara:strand:+ start:30916 stop:31737 length:822 start_codon:yes stop_codon:yes gene_type:complete
MFIIGKEYHRKSEIHGVYKGQSQGGISTPKEHNLIFLFTSEGEENGYIDEYRPDGTFWYTGEGQVSDMQMKGVNLAILSHIQDKKVIHVFEYTRKAYVRYLGQAECLGYHEEARPNKFGHDRKAIIFHLDIDSTPFETPRKVVNKKEWSPSDLREKSLKELRDAALQKPYEAASKSEKRQSAYYRSKALKLYVSRRSNGLCEGCTMPSPFHTKKGPYIECHHLHRLADGGPDHPINVIGLCPNCHRRAHHAKDFREFNDSLKIVVKKIEQNIL